MKRYAAPILAALLALALLAGCGSSSSNDNAASSNPPSAYGGSAASDPSSSTTASGETEQIKTAKADPGTILVDAGGRAVYLFEKDQNGKSSCNDACAQSWPPVTTNGAPSAGDGVTGSMIGTIKRDDGSMQVTYGGHPLYYYAGDSGPGDTGGQGLDDFGAEWYVVGPNGKQVEGDES